MSEETKVLTQEEQDAHDRAAAECAAEVIASYQFMEKHLNDDDFGFAATPENGKKMSDFIKGKGWKWSTEALQTAYEELSAAGELTKVVLPAAQPEPIEDVESTPAESFPWGRRLTPQILQEMSGREMGKWLANEKWRDEFQRQVNVLQLPKSFLRMNF